MQRRRPPGRRRRMSRRICWQAWRRKPAAKRRTCQTGWQVSRLRPSPRQERLPQLHPKLTFLLSSTGADPTRRASLQRELSINPKNKTSYPIGFPGRPDSRKRRSSWMKIPSPWREVGQAAPMFQFLPLASRLLKKRISAGFEIWKRLPNRLAILSLLNLSRIGQRALRLRSPPPHSSRRRKI